MNSTTEEDGRMPDVGFDTPDDNTVAFTPRFLPADPRTQYVQYILMGLVGVNIVGLGGQAQGEVMLHLIQNPLAIGLGMFCRLGLLPALMLGVSRALSLTKPLSLALLCTLMAPGEGAAALLVLLAEADVDLFFTLSCFNAFTCTAIMPLWTILFETELYGQPGYLGIPFMQMFIILAVILAAGFIGYLLREKCFDIYDKFWLYIPVMSVFTMLCILAIEIYNNYFIFKHLTVMVVVVSLVLSAFGFLLGFGVAYLFRQSKGRMITLALETGVRSSYITHLCVTMTVPLPQAQEVLATPVLCGLLTMIPSFITVMVYRVKNKCRNLKEDVDFIEEQMVSKECLTMIHEQIKHNGDVIEDTEDTI